LDNKIFLISLGGILGANFRYAFQHVIENYFGISSSISILLINTLGCFLLGYISAFLY